MREGAGKRGMAGFGTGQAASGTSSVQRVSMRLKGSSGQVELASTSQGRTGPSHVGVVAQTYAESGGRVEECSSYQACLSARDVGELEVIQSGAAHDCGFSRVHGAGMEERQKRGSRSMCIQSYLSRPCT